MTLWESIVAVAVVTLCLPMIATAQTNVVGAVRTARALSDESLIFSSISDDWFNGDKLQTSMTEEGTTYTISTKTFTRTDADTSPYTVFRIDLQSTGRRAVSSQLEIPICQASLFTH